ncbi:hypothetical protein R1sor_001707 [Riccia sorocarpa]|uniref:tRNA (adenine(58)-N(1))-methyltransferase non-catalytic subunit TRM6 n=1 Tax=Riccia sorocarpa TaxID=122646 RepID=A0ABD3GWQ2_9MARC
MSMIGKSTIQNCAEFGSSVLLDINDGDKMTFARLHSASTLKVGNMKCNLDALVGQPYGAVFELQSERNSAKLVRLPTGSGINGTKEKQEHCDADQNSEEVKGRDNRALVDDNKAQTLSCDDIDRMKREGASGREIIEALVANSASFETKTAFSQEKYMKKKQKKYAPRVLLRRPSARRFCRMDTLALMMSLANVGPKSDILVLESLGGLITAAAAERVGGHGSVCSAYYTTKRPPIDMVRLLNLDDATAVSVVRAPLEKLVAARRLALSCKEQAPAVLKGSEVQNGGEVPVGNDQALPAVLEGQNLAQVQNGREEVKVSVPPQEEAMTMAGESVPVENSGSHSMEVDQEEKSNATAVEGRQEDGCEPLDKEHNAAEGEGKASKGPRPGNEASSSDIQRWASQGFSSLLVAAPELDPWTVIKNILPLLSSSSPFVIYSMYQQPLAECMYQLQKNNMAVAIQLTEPWCREYQDNKPSLKHVDTLLRVGLITSRFSPAVEIGDVDPLQTKDTLPIFQ